MEVSQSDNQELVNLQNKQESPSPEKIVDVIEKSKDSEPEQQPVKKSKDARGRKKDERSVEQVLKALSSLGTNEEKLAAVCKKYSDIFDENRKLQLSIKQSDKKVAALQRELELLQAEQSKAVLTRSRLESLCRELQRQNKAIKDESLLKIREEEEKRKVVSAKFQATLSEITALMQQNNENNSKLRDENIEMQNKFKSVCEQYELREQQVEKISKQMQLESQLHDAKLAKVKIEMVAEKEILLNEKKQLMLELAAYQGKCQELQKTEAALRSQISMYTEKYDEFQNALARSNQIYGGFKGEMEKMSKKITKLEKETSTWKMKWESSHRALLQMAAEKQQRDADLALAAKQLAQLQKLCRTLQSERSSLLQQLKTEGLTPKVSGDADQSESTNAKDNQNCEFMTNNKPSKGDESTVHDTTQNKSNATNEDSKEKQNAVPVEDLKPNESRVISPDSQNNESILEKVKSGGAVEKQKPSKEVKSSTNEASSLKKESPKAEVKSANKDEKLAKALSPDAKSPVSQSVSATQPVELKPAAEANLSNSEIKPSTEVKPTSPECKASKNEVKSPGKTETSSNNAVEVPQVVASGKESLVVETIPPDSETKAAVIEAKPVAVANPLTNDVTPSNANKSTPVNVEPEVVFSPVEGENVQESNAQQTLPLNGLNQAGDSLTPNKNPVAPEPRKNKEGKRRKK